MSTSPRSGGVGITFLHRWKNVVFADWVVKNDLILPFFCRESGVNYLKKFCKYWFFAVILPSISNWTSAQKHNYRCRKCPSDGNFPHFWEWIFLDIYINRHRRAQREIAVKEFWNYYDYWADAEIALAYADNDKAALWDAVSYGCESDCNAISLV